MAFENWAASNLNKSFCAQKKFQSDIIETASENNTPSNIMPKGKWLSSNNTRED